MSMPLANQPETHANPVDEGLPEVIRCLADWLKENGPSEQKAHRILSALAQESLKKVTRDREQRRFTADEITAAAGEEFWTRAKSQNEWLDWPGTVEKYWKSQEPEVIQFASSRGLKRYPKPQRNSTPGRHKATYEILAEPVPEHGEEFETPISSVGQDGIRYEVTKPGDVNLTWWAKIIFRRGEFRLSGWRRWLIVCWMIGIIAGCTLLMFALYFSLLASRPVTTRELASFIAMVGIPAWVWFDVVRPWFRLHEDRIRTASDLVLALREKPAQIEVFRDNDLRVIRFVRYTATCPVCGATIYLDDGSPDFPRRLVGRCSESPREHVFSFDRVTRRGDVLRAPFFEGSI